MANLIDILKRGKGLVGRTSDLVRQKTADAAEAARNFATDFKTGRAVGTAARGARGATEAGMQGARGAATKVSDAFSEVRGPARPTINVDSAGNASTNPPRPAQAGRASIFDKSFETPLQDHNAKIRTMNNPHLATDAGQQAVGKANDNFKAKAPVPPTGGANPPRFGALRRAGTVLGRVAAPIAPAMAAASTVESGGTPTSDFRKEFGLPETSRVGRGLRGIGVPENEAQFADDIAVRLAGVGSRVANAATGGLAGMAGSAFADAAQAQGPRGASTTPPVPGKAPTPTQVQDVAVERQDPAAILDDPSTPIPEGTGAFQRTTPGNRGPATLVDSRPSLRDAEATPTQQDPNSPFQRLTPGGRGPQANLAGGFAALAAKRINENVQGARIDRVTKAAVARQAGAAVRGKGVDAFVANEVKRDTTLSKDKDERAQQIDERTADLSQRFSRAAASLGKDKSDLTPVELSQIKIGNDFRKSLENRGTIEFFRDLFGENRFDHENPLSYLPTDFQPSALGASISLGGNRIQVSKATRNGETHWFAPNDPTKADLTAFVELARKSKKGSK